MRARENLAVRQCVRHPSDRGARTLLLPSSLTLSRSACTGETALSNTPTSANHVNRNATGRYNYKRRKRKGRSNSIRRREDSRLSRDLRLIIFELDEEKRRLNKKKLKKKDINDI